ncbi:hypothetical protein EI42_04728 [Thermosporothrix hazakensis]|jgi:hypothetical protein|uniref:Uncharacterized protein n=2 Tax=Thermosporothrix TaxID=768650 RepID=A0A326U227_THEHA|nr:hypothetical protein [Thermosporothrix hazakensis]PZW24037.1 hypothetical protein EI42_04728 [Thermosporothrix hazakensis]BBH87824.1 hypothetical protein KTC_25750 [Thermosporothrix sp. COM3]GCE50252.1 hypothetical protein KTH_51210 [Thermosporothrix hazakensis]
MPMRLGEPLQTIARVYEDICAGEEPWVALGNFLNDWFLYATDRQRDLIAERPRFRAHPTLIERRWACFLAATVEYLCQLYALPCPRWVFESPEAQALDTPWYDVHYLDPEIQQWLEETTPEPFRRRNIYCGGQLFLDKREIIAL